MKCISVLTLFVCLGAGLTAAPPVPRPAQEFRCPDSKGNQISISALRGKVVVMQFLSTTCPHCQAYSRLLTRLQKDYGPKGFQAVAVAFNDATPEMVRDYVASNAVGIPVGYAPRESVLRYLGISIMQRLTVPQVLIIDRHGQVRAQSEPLGTPQLQDETYLRGLIEGLLK